MSREKIDLTGQRFNSWSVLERDFNGKNREARWLCRCVCGRESTVRGYDLRNGSSRQCNHCGSITHGLSRTKLYRVWQSMVARCENPNDKRYKNYGGRGIEVCCKWQKDFKAFYNWSVENRYKEGLTIDRIDNDGDYKPSNCRFVTWKVQNRNNRHNRMVKIGEEIKPVIEWAELSGIHCNTLIKRLNAGWPENRVLEPVRT